MAAREFPIMQSSIDRIFLEYLSISKPLFEAFLSGENYKRKQRGVELPKSLDKVDSKGELIPITLNNKEIDVLSEMMRIQYLKPTDNVLSLENKEEIRNNLENMSPFSLNNNIKSLRDKQAIIGNRVAAIFNINPGNDIFQLVFKFKING